MRTLVRTFEHRRLLSGATTATTAAASAAVGAAGDESPDLAALAHLGNLPSEVVGPAGAVATRRG